jgi:hypothetical protein
MTSKTLRRKQGPDFRFKERDIFARKRFRSSGGGGKQHGG